MAANDYHVIVYQILAYLYSCLKDGVDVDLASIEKFKEDNLINILRQIEEIYTDNSINIDFVFDPTHF